MGNCVVSRSAREERYMGVDGPSGSLIQKGRGSSNNNEKNSNASTKDSDDPFSPFAEATEQETTGSDMGDLTAPMSPDFSLSPPQQQQPPEQSPYHMIATNMLTSTSLDFEREAAEEAQDVVSPLSSVPSPRRPSRAFQARLQKAKHMQMALNGGAHNHIHRRRRRSLGGSCSPSPLQQINHGSSMSVASTISASSSVTSIDTASVAAATTSDELQAGCPPEEAAAMIREASPWAELQVEDGAAVLCTAMSRLTASLSNPKPPLYLAVGTDSGSVVVRELNCSQLQQQQEATTELLQHLPDSNTEEGRNAGVVSMDMAPHANNKSKLGRPVRLQLEHAASRVRSLDFSPDGQFLAVGGDDCQCHVYRLHCSSSSEPNNSSDEEEDDNDNNENNTRHAKLSMLAWVADIERVDRVTTVQFSANSKYLAVGGYDCKVAIFETDDLSRQMQMEPVIEISRGGLILSIDWSPDSRFLAIGGSDKCCAIVDCQEAASWNVFREIRRKSTIQSVRWYPTGKYLAIGTADTVAIVVGRDSFATMNEIQLPKSSGGNRNRTTSAMCWSPNGSYLVVCGSPRTCTLYETQSFTMVHQISRSGNITSIVWGQQGILSNSATMPQRFMAIGTEDSKVSVVKAGVEVSMRAGSSVGGDDASTSLASSASYFSSRGDWVLKENIFHDLDETIEASIGANGVNITVGDGTATVLTVAFSRGSKSRPSAFFAHSTDDGLVTVRHTTDWKVVAEIQFPKPVPTMTFSTGSRYLALGCFDSNVYISDTASNWELVAKIEFAAPITALRFGSKTNDRFAVGTVDGTMAFLDTSGGFDFAGEIVTSSSPVAALDWSSKNLAVGREDGTVAVYETNQVINDVYESVADLDRKKAVTAVTFGVSSRFLAVGGVDGLVGIYSSKGGWVLCHQLSLDRSVSAVLWCPLGRHLAYGSESGQIKVIDTIFWAEVVEAETPAAVSEDRIAIQSNLAFSQDGKLFAFSRSDLGFGVLDSAQKWNFVVNMLDDGGKATEIEDDSVGSDLNVAPSSISSEEESGDSPMEDDGEGRYEV